eukprot:gene25253-27332_t
MPLFTLVIPLSTTLRDLSQYGSNIPPPSHATSERVREYHERRATAFGHDVLLWVILGIYHSAVTLLSLVPFSSRALSLLPISKELVIVTLIWVQLSSSFAGALFRLAITPVLRRVAAVFPAGGVSELESAAASKGRTVLGLLKMVGLITSSQEGFLKSLFQDGLATLLAAVFIFTPTPLATVGMVIIGLLLPAFRSSCTSPLVQSNRPRIASEANSIAVEQRKLWLDYWVCIAFLWTLRIYSLSVWPSIMMIASLWLQHTYFQGATWTLRSLVETWTELAERNTAIHARNATA